MPEARCSGATTSFDLAIDEDRRNSAAMAAARLQWIAASRVAIERL